MEFRIPSQPGVYTQVPTAEQPVHQQPTGQPGHTVFVHTTQYTPVPAQRRELWFSSSMFGNNYAIEQPDPGRIVLSGSRSKYTGMVRYTYADQLPCMIQASIVCTVIFGILASPVTLLCCIPLILSMKTTYERASEGQIQSARDWWCLSQMWCTFAIMWITGFIVALVTVIVVVAT